MIFVQWTFTKPDSQLEITASPPHSLPGRVGNVSENPASPDYRLVTFRQAWLNIHHIAMAYMYI